MHSCVAALCALVVSCATVRVQAPTTETSTIVLQAVAFSALPGWKDDTPSDALPSFAASCRALIARGESSSIWRGACAAAPSIEAHDDAAARAFFEAQFTPYRVVTADGVDVGRVTGYYEPLLKGSRVRTDRYRYPLYAPPDDLLTVDLSELFPALKERARSRTRRRQARRALLVPRGHRGRKGRNVGRRAGLARRRGRSVLRADAGLGPGSASPMAAALRIGYADQNGLPYRSIGRVLIDRGELTLETASMQGIKAWGRQHPDQLPALLDENPSYVFFGKWRPILAAPSMVLSAPSACHSPRVGRSPSIHGFCPLARPFFWRQRSRFPMYRCDDSSWHRTPVARSAARCVPISSGARATTRDAAPGG